MSAWLENHLFINHALGGLFYISFYIMYSLFIIYINWYIYDIGIKNKFLRNSILILTWLISLVILCIELK